MIVPTVHLNGTSREALIEELQDAISALDIARGAMRSAWPNPRDYYVQQGDAYRAAHAEWQARYDAVLKVENELSQILEAIAL